jgi:hypothetical protein
VYANRVEALGFEIFGDLLDRDFSWHWFQHHANTFFLLQSKSVKRNPFVLEKAGRGAEFVRSGELDADPFCALTGFYEVNFCG